MNRRGKKVLDIEWEREGIKLKIPVRAHMVRDYGKSEDVMTFKADREDPPIHVENSDINVVRKAVLAELDAWYSITWEAWFMVTISGGSRGQAGGFEVNFGMTFYAIGKDVRGTTRHMTIPRPERFDKPNERLTKWGGETPKDGMPETGENLKGDSYYSRSRTKALVKATLENVKAADSFIEAMEALLGKMHHHFSPERIEKLLAKSGKMLLGQLAE